MSPEPFSAEAITKVAAALAELPVLPGMTWGMPVTTVDQLCEHLRRYAEALQEHRASERQAYQDFWCFREVGEFVSIARGLDDAAPVAAETSDWAVMTLRRQLAALVPLVDHMFVLRQMLMGAQARSVDRETIAGAWGVSPECVGLLAPPTEDRDEP